MSETEKLMIRGDRLLLALHQIDSLSWDASRIEEPKIPLTISKRYPCLADSHGTPFQLYWGSPEDPGLGELHRLLKHAMGTNLVYFAIEDVLDVFVAEWKHYCDDQEYLSVLNFFTAIASGELTEADFKEVK